ncbi:MAG: glycine zipper family protein [Candidatus Methylomirabilales bacterium]
MRKIVIVIMLVLAGCAGYRPIVDMRGVDESRYEADLRECQQYARELSPAGEAATGALIGAALGAATGAALGASTGAGAGWGARSGVAYGGIGGMAYGGANALAAQRNVIVVCLQGRGYRVLR